MSKAKHTPGPWEFGSGDDYYVRADAYPKNFPHRFKSDDLGDYLAYVGNRTDDFGEADARLIAAAPDLLAAVQSIPTILNHMKGTGSWDTETLNRAIEIVISASRAAIAKATGAAP